MAESSSSQADKTPALFWVFEPGVYMERRLICEAELENPSSELFDLDMTTPGPLEFEWVEGKNTFRFYTLTRPSNRVPVWLERRWCLQVYNTFELYKVKSLSFFYENLQNERAAPIDTDEHGPVGKPAPLSRTFQYLRTAKERAPYKEDLTKQILVHDTHERFVLVASCFFEIDTGPHAQLSSNEWSLMRYLRAAAQTPIYVEVEPMSRPKYRYFVYADLRSANTLDEVFKAVCGHAGIKDIRFYQVNEPWLVQVVTTNLATNTSTFSSVSRVLGERSFIDDEKRYMSERPTASSTQEKSPFVFAPTVPVTPQQKRFAFIHAGIANVPHNLTTYVCTVDTVSDGYVVCCGCSALATTVCKPCGHRAYCDHHQAKVLVSNFLSEHCPMCLEPITHMAPSPFVLAERADVRNVGPDRTHDLACASCNHDALGIFLPCSHTSFCARHDRAYLTGPYGVYCPHCQELIDSVDYFEGSVPDFGKAPAATSSSSSSSSSKVKAKKQPRKWDVGDYYDVEDGWMDLFDDDSDEENLKALMVPEKKDKKEQPSKWDVGDYYDVEDGWMDLLDNDCDEENLQAFMAPEKKDKKGKGKEKEKRH